MGNHVVILSLYIRVVIVVYYTTGAGNFFIIIPA